MLREMGSLSGGDPSGNGTGDQSLEAVVDRDLIQRALSCLSSEECEAIALRYGADLTVPEIAKLTGQRQTTVEGRVYRSLRKLREEMAPEAAFAMPQ